MGTGRGGQQEPHGYPDLPAPHSSGGTFRSVTEKPQLRGSWATEWPLLGEGSAHLPSSCSAPSSLTAQPSPLLCCSPVSQEHPPSMQPTMSCGGHTSHKPTALCFSAVENSPNSVCLGGGSRKLSRRHRSSLPPQQRLSLWLWGLPSTHWLPAHPLLPSSDLYPLNC